MSSTEQTPTPQQPSDQRELTVSVPEDRVEQFHTFYERFLASSKRRERPSDVGRGSRGRGGRGGHRRRHIRRAMFHLAMAEQGLRASHGRCAGRRAEGESTAPAPARTL